MGSFLLHEPSWARVLVFAGWLAWSNGAPAQSSSQAAVADALLNRTYQQTLGRLNDSEKGRARISQRAWLVAQEKTTAAFRGAGAAARRPPETVLTGEVVARSAQLQRLGAGGGDDARAAAWMEQSDAALNAVYRQCLALLAPPARELLRLSQRAWLEFRDAEGRVRPGIAFSQVATVTERRGEELRQFYLDANGAPAPAVATQPKAAPLAARDEETDPSFPNPFERAK